MVVAVTIDDAGLLALVLELANLTNDLESLFVGLGTGVGKIHTAQAGHLGNQLFGKFDGGHVANAVGEVAQIHHLRSHRVHDFLAAITHVHCPHTAGNGIEIGLAANIRDAHALALDIDGWLKALMLGQMMPDVRLVQGDQLFLVKRHGLVLLS